jgi:hypothetical protein
MKRLILIAILSCIAVLSQATIYNVDNNSNRSSGYYDLLQIAINTASAGDTIYLYPSNTSYGNITLTKKLHIFGSGYDGSTGAVSKIEALTLDTTTSPSSNPSGSSIQGITFVNNISCSKSNISNVVLVGNYFNSYYGLTLHNNCSGWLITNNYFYGGSINLNDNTSIIISNNVFGSNSNAIIYSNSPSVVISNNLFMNWRYFSQVFNATISNNIFVCNGVTESSAMANNVFTNNISWRTNLATYNLPPESNTGSGNFGNQDPQFVSAPSSGSFDFTKDYHLKTSSPGKNAGSDGTDIGIYGGTNPFIWGGVLSIPKVTDLLISNPVVNQGTPINVNVKAKKAEL